MLGSSIMEAMRCSGFIHWALWVGCVLGVGCGDDSSPSSGGGGSNGGQGGSPVVGGSGGSGGMGDSGGAPPIPLVSASKIDLLVGVDNSRGMADKQLLLSQVAGKLLGGFVNPPCVDSTGAPSASQPATPDTPCEAGFNRVHAPIEDIHVGVVSSSLGGLGSDSCAAINTFSCPNAEPNTSADDGGHLISRVDPCQAGTVPTYQNLGFLAWDPKAKQTPPGESDFATLVSSFQSIVLGAGQIGCGYEAALESWYRFLIQPDPYQTIQLSAQSEITQVGTDQALLDQRAAFLRPDSMLIVLMVSDENDCSIAATGQGWVALQQRDPSNPNKSFRLPRARSECAVDPNDPCCASCGLATPAGCSPSSNDPQCQMGSYDAVNDDPNLRCFDQKRRFGIDFMYPIDRYVDGLANAQVPDRVGNLLPNPIYGNLSNNPDSPVRDSRFVLLAGIVGVPWQDISRSPSSLTEGVKSADELAMADVAGRTTWDYVVGDPAANVIPLDPHMVELATPRTGINPITGTALAPPNSPPDADPINGHEYTVGLVAGNFVAYDDLEYACVFPLPAARDCTQLVLSCECQDGLNDKPVCEPNPNDNNNRTLQTRARVNPAPRQLQTLHRLGSQAVVGSACPADIVDPDSAAFAYAPTVESIFAAVRPLLSPPD